MCCKICLFFLCLPIVYYNIYYHELYENYQLSIFVCLQTPLCLNDTIVNIKYCMLNILIALPYTVII